MNMDLKQLLECLDLLTDGKKLDLACGNFNYDPKQNLTPEQLIESERLLLQNHSDPAGNQVFIAQMLRTETTLALDTFNIAPRFASTRQTIDDTILNIVGPQGKVALPLPNWTFWFTDGPKKGDFSYEYISAENPDQLVSYFKNMAPKVKAFLLTNPQNPWGYKIEREHCVAMDKIAQKHGVTIIIDEVLRGNQPLNDRESLGIHFAQPYVIEGFSHRFGLGLQNFSYVLSPKGKKAGVTTSKQAPAKLLEMIYQTSTRPCLSEIKKRNAALREGLFGADVSYLQSADTQITSLLELPRGFEVLDVLEQARAADIPLLSIHSFTPPGIDPIARYENMLRLSVGMVSASDAYDAGDRLSQILR